MMATTMMVIPVLYYMNSCGDSGENNDGDDILVNRPIYSDSEDDADDDFIEKQRKKEGGGGGNNNNKKKGQGPVTTICHLVGHGPMHRALKPEKATMPSNHATRTGLFPTVINKGETQPKSTVKPRAKAATATKSKAVKTPVVTSILKRKSELNTDKRRSAPATATPSSGRHVKFKSKASDQESLREKLNDWLVAKGKTPSRCQHLMCFNAQVSAKKRKSEPQDKLVDRTITQNLLSSQFKVLKNEEQTAETKKKLFEDGPSSAKKPRRSIEKENHQTKRSIRFDDEPHTENIKEDIGGKKSPVHQEEPQSPIPDMIRAAASSAPDSSSDLALRHLETLLQECLALYEADCPLETLLAWLADIEEFVPRALTFTPYYVCKAKVLSAFPQLVLEVFAQAVRHNAQPCAQLALEMQASLSVLLIPPSKKSPYLPSHSYGEESISMPQTATTNRKLALLPSPVYPASRRRPSLPRHSSNISMSSSEGSRLGDTTNSLAQLSEVGSYGERNSLSQLSEVGSYGERNTANSLAQLSEVGSYGERNSLSQLSEVGSYGESLSSETDITDNNGTYGTFSVLSVSAASSRLSSPLSSSRCSTPLEYLRRSNGNVSQRDSYGLQEKRTPATTGPVTESGRKKLGSTVKYSIGSTTPLLKNVAEASPAIAVVTPVRRSTRLSNRQLTPGVELRREIASVSDLSEKERQTMLFQTNPAITGN
ncbi:cytoskeleton-associated protein 2-like [Elysia marginata]|uniref:Cytoskeleton-associated protein 2-like n=1 Tax=Elysia marginata TaxID=1093978 RepID=A0AAV4GK54_9GAST|nr:cytoskeleton-associated protein 2-like [Elysia marginata]